MTLTTALNVEEVALDDLRPDPANPRRIGDDELEALTRSLRQFGFVQPVCRGSSLVLSARGFEVPPERSRAPR